MAYSSGFLLSDSVTGVFGGVASVVTELRQQWRVIISHAAVRERFALKSEINR
jgi:hypothetical protein